MKGVASVFDYGQVGDWWDSQSNVSSSPIQNLSTHIHSQNQQIASADKSPDRSMVPPDVGNLYFFSCLNRSARPHHNLISQKFILLDYFRMGAYPSLISTISLKSTTVPLISKLLSVLSTVYSISMTSPFFM